MFCILENRMTITDPNNDLIEKHLLRVETNFQKGNKSRKIAKLIF